MATHSLRHYVTRLVPLPVRRLLKELRWSLRVNAAMRDLLKVPPGQMPPLESLHALSAAWGNEGYSARREYLEEVARRSAQSAGPILECGTGLTTMVMAAVAGRRGITICSLEHDPSWASRVSRRLKAVGLDPGFILIAPLSSFDGYSWYEPREADLPRDFGLVICDGPPGDTAGGRYGLLPRMKSRLKRGAFILLDDALRDSEQQVLRRWAAEGCVAVSPSPDAGTYAIVECR